MCLYSTRRNSNEAVVTRYGKNLRECVKYLGLISGGKKILAKM